MQSALKGVEGVDSVEVAFDKKEALVKAKESVTEETLLKAVEKAGYKATVKKEEKKEEKGHEGHKH